MCPLLGHGGKIQHESWAWPQVIVALSIRFHRVCSEMTQISRQITSESYTRLKLVWISLETKLVSESVASTLQASEIQIRFTLADNTLRIDSTTWQQNWVRSKWCKGCLETCIREYPHAAHHVLSAPLLLLLYLWDWVSVTDTTSQLCSCRSAPHES